VAAGLSFRNVTADDYGLVAQVDAVFTPSTQPPSENMTLIYYDQSSMERTVNITLGSSNRLNLRLFGDPANFPFDTYRSNIICKFQTSSGEVWTTVTISPTLTVTPRIESKWWVLPSVDGSSYYFFVVRNPFGRFLRFGCLPLFIFLLPLALLIDHKKLSERALLVITIFVAGEGLAVSLPYERPAILTQEDVLHFWFIVGAILLLSYCVLSKRLPSESATERTRAFLCFLPSPFFATVFVLEQVFVQSQYSQLGADIWISTLNVGQAICYSILGATIVVSWWKPSWNVPHESWSHAVFGILAAMLFLPLALILYSLKGANPLEPAVIAIYLTTVLVSMLVRAKLQIERFGISMIVAGNMLYSIIFAYNYLREYSPASYNPLVHVAKETVAPGIYVWWGPHDPLSATIAVVLAFLVLTPTLIPFALIERIWHQPVLGASTQII
jgi:hypothetical protein